MALIERELQLEVRVVLDCGHTRTAPAGTRRIECWTCGDIGSVVGAAH